VRGLIAEVEMIVDVGESGVGWREAEAF